jgi:hypothetical protein
LPHRQIVQLFSQPELKIPIFLRPFFRRGSMKWMTAKSGINCREMVIATGRLTKLAVFFSHLDPSTRLTEGHSSLRIPQGNTPLAWGFCIAASTFRPFPPLSPPPRIKLPRDACVTPDSAHIATRRPCTASHGLHLVDFRRINQLIMERRNQWHEKPSPTTVIA